MEKQSAGAALLKKIVAISTTSLQPKGTKTCTAKVFWLPARGYIGTCCIYRDAVEPREGLIEA